MEVWVGVIASIFGGGVGAFFTYRVSMKKVDQSAFQILYNELKEDNERLRISEKQMHEEVRDLRRQVDDLSIKLQLMESAHLDLPLPQWLKDTHGRMLSINPEYTRVFGKSSEEYRGKTDFEVWDYDIAKQFDQHDKSVYRLRKMLYFIEKIKMPDGAEEEWLIIKYPRYSGNIIIGIGGIAVNNTADLVKKVRDNA